MFCKNCGANLPDGATFCGSCGSKQDVPVQTPVAPVDGHSQQSQTQTQAVRGYTPQLNLNGFAIGHVKGMRLIAFIAMALVAIFAITEYMYMKVSAMGQSFEYSFNFMELFDGNLLNGDPATGYTIFMYIILITNIVALAACAGYIAFTFIGGPAANSPLAIQKCILCATVALVALAVGLICCFICPSPVPKEANEFMSQADISTDYGFGYGFLGWFSIIIVAAVRFYVLPICMKESVNG